MIEQFSPFKATLLALAMAASLGAQNASATTITATTSALEWDPAPILNNLADLTLSLTGLDTNATSDLAVTFKVRADLDSNFEFVTMSIDGYSFGIWLNDNLGDDTITDAVSDSGGPFSNQSAAIFTGTASIPLVSFLPLLADGSLSALFDFSVSVTDLANPSYNGFESPEYAEFSISYETAAQAVPEPASLALLSIGLVGLGIRRRRQRN